MREHLNRIFKVGWTNFKRNSYLSFGTTGVMALVLILFSGLMVVNFLSSTIIGSLEDKVDISVYFKNEASEGEIREVRQQLENFGSVARVEYISRGQALEDFKARHAGDALIQESLAELEDNPLQASLNVKATDSSKYPAIVEFLEANKFRSLVDKINFYENEQVIRRVQSISNGMRNWGFLATMVLAVVAVLVTFNTIRLTIYNQRQEIEIMRLVGGSNWHIKAPYLVEGGLYGALAAATTLIVFYPVAYFLSPKIESLMPGVSLLGYFVSNGFQYVFLVAFVGILLGVASSFIAIRRFLKV
ncbi:MAG: FtsX-like permease family protein [Candidatus Yanofskybacteria bacterium]|nr:FtsX-like permease family protein [Candidatus Yanofskybacteria bacterium]